MHVLYTSIFECLGEAKPYLNDIGINTRDLFLFMQLMVLSSDWIVATKGKNSSFYFAPKKKNESLKSSDKPLQSILKNIRTHFSSEQAPHYNNVLMVQVELWKFEQHNSFFMNKEWLDFFRRLLRLRLDVYEYYVLHADSIENFCKHVDIYEKRLWRSAVDLFSPQKTLLNEDPFLRKIFKAAGLFV